MPYDSDAQRRFFHTDTAKKKGITNAVVKDYDQASKGLKLPTKKDPLNKAMGKVGSGGNY